MADSVPDWLTSTGSAPAPTTATATTPTTSKKTVIPTPTAGRKTTTANSNNTTSSSSSSSNGGGYVPNFKVTLIGDAGVGKTSLFNWLRHQEHGHHDATSSLASCSTVCVDTCAHTFCTRYGNVTITLWDTAGVERYRTLTRNYYRNSNAALLVCSVDNTSTLYSLPRWQRDVVESAPTALYFLLGNKSDLERQVSDDTFKAFADSNNCQAAFLTSAKTGEGIKEALISVCEHLMDSYHHTAVMQDRDELWLQGSGLHVHGSDEHDVKRRLCC